MKINRRDFLMALVGIGTLAVSFVYIVYQFMGRIGKKLVGMLPPGQREVDRFRVIHVESIPQFDEETWTFEVYGLVKNPFIITYEQLRKLPKIVSISDFHCVEGWSKLGNKWEGVRFRTIMEIAEPQEKASFATIESEHGYTTSLPLEDLSGDDVLLAYRLDDEKLPPQYGGPLRIVVPHKYAYKSAKWVWKIRFTEEQELGYWETRGYSNTADPLTEDRFA